MWIDLNFIHTHQREFLLFQLFLLPWFSLYFLLKLKLLLNYCDSHVTTWRQHCSILVIKLGVEISKQTLKWVLFLHIDYENFFLMAGVWLNIQNPTTPYVSMVGVIWKSAQTQNHQILFSQALLNVCTLGLCWEAGIYSQSLWLLLVWTRKTACFCFVQDDVPLSFLQCCIYISIH